MEFTWGSSDLSDFVFGGLGSAWGENDFEMNKLTLAQDARVGVDICLNREGSRSGSWPLVIETIIEMGAQQVPGKAQRICWRDVPCGAMWGSGRIQGAKELPGPGECGKWWPGCGTW